jgi:hypothetical protein
MSARSFVMKRFITLRCFTWLAAVLIVSSTIVAAPAGGQEDGNVVRGPQPTGEAHFHLAEFDHETSPHLSCQCLDRFNADRSDADFKPAWSALCENYAYSHGNRFGQPDRNMRRMISRLSVAVAALTWTWTVMAAETPAYKAVPAAKIKPREGSGHLMAKIRAGHTVTVAYLGGSITAANGWRPKTTAWLQKTFPSARFKEIDAAIGGTGSDLGAFRVGHDALQYNPDLLFVEFAVNDGGAAPESIWRSMEGIVRQTWRKDPRTDIVFAYTIHQDMIDDVKRGSCPRSASAMELLADFYGIPSVNFAVPVVELLEQGKLVFQSDVRPANGRVWFSTDGCHPRDEGHEIYLKLMAEAITRMKDGQPADHQAKLAKTFIAGNWETAKMVPLSRNMFSGSWKALPANDSKQKSFGHRMGQIWMASQPGTKLHFKFKGSAATLYDLVGPDGGQMVITVDGQTRAKAAPRFDSYCTYHRIATLELVSYADPSQVHDVTVEIHPEQPDRKSVAFRLKDPDKELTAAKYQGTRVWASQLLILGDLAE